MSLPFVRMGAARRCEACEKTSRIQPEHVVGRPHPAGERPEAPTSPEVAALPPDHAEAVVVAAAASVGGERQRRKRLLSYFGLGVGLMAVLTGLMLMTAGNGELPVINVLAERVGDESLPVGELPTQVLETRVIEIEGRRVLALADDVMAASDRVTLALITTPDHHAWRAEFPELVDGPVRIEIGEPIGTLCVVTLVEGVSP
ncbi:MAG: hypothetical protein RLN76_07590 [Phycisphaeraceae bacterium]